MNINPFANVSLQDYLEIVQIVDSTFPIGSFNHSFGMENYLREDTVTDDKGYEEWQEAYLASQFKYGEGLVIKLVYDAMATDNLEQVWHYDKVLTVSTQARETRQGTKMIAKQMLRLIQRLHASVISTMVQNAVRAIPLGQFAGQEIVLRSFSQLEKMTQEIQELDASYLGANTPGLELAQMKHETQVFRLFMS